ASRRPYGDRVLVRDVLFHDRAGGGHAALPSVVGPSVAQGLRGSDRGCAALWRGSSRHIARMRPGAATNMITSAWMNVRRSSGMPVLTCIRPPPVRNAPNSNAAATIPSGRLPARRASAIALNPKPALMSLDIWGTVPRTSIEPPRPASAPDRTIARMIEPEALMPA